MQRKEPAVSKMSELLWNYKQHYDENNDELRLDGHGFTNAELRELMAFLELHPEIKKLVIHSNNIDDEGAEIIAKNRTITNIDAAYNRIGNAGIKALACNPTITSLDIVDNPFDHDGAKSFLENKHILQLRSITRYQIGELYEKIKVRLEKNIHAKPARIYPSTNHISKFLKLFKNHSTTKLSFVANYLDFYYENNHELDLSDLNLTEKEMPELCEFLQKHPEIKSLKLRNNNIGNEGARLLAQNTTLERLNVSNNNLQDDAITYLAANTTLKSLDVAYNNFSYANNDLAINKTLKSLNISHNNIQGFHVRLYAKNTTLTSLNMSYSSANHIENHSLAGFLKNKTLSYLNIDYNSFSDEAYERIKKHIQDNFMRKKQKENWVRFNWLQAQILRQKNYINQRNILKLIFDKTVHHRFFNKDENKAIKEMEALRTKVMQDSNQFHPGKRV